MRLPNSLPHPLRKALDKGWPLLVTAGCSEYRDSHPELGVDIIMVNLRHADREPAGKGGTGPADGSGFESLTSGLCEQRF